MWSYLQATALFNLTMVRNGENMTNMDKLRGKIIALGALYNAKFDILDEDTVSEYGLAIHAIKVIFVEEPAWAVAFIAEKARGCWPEVHVVEHGNRTLSFMA